jgi:Raf kinase inhibitor-like YbhB/YbcL family protein
MLEKLPAAVGHALENNRAGVEKILYQSVRREHEWAPLSVSSSAFLPGSRIPTRFTADGDGVSPPLQWGTTPADATSLALIVEDADAPTPEPLVHAIVVNIDPRLRGLEEGAISAGTTDSPANVGRNSFLRRAWLPPDPPPGHGVHRYAFQLFALLPGDEFSTAPGRKELATAIQQRAVGSGFFVGTYQREEKA